MSQLEKRIENLETARPSEPLEPLHIFESGAEPGPEKKYYIGKNGEIPPMVVIHKRGCNDE